MEPRSSQPPGISCIFQLWNLSYRSLLGYSLGPDKLKRARRAPTVPSSKVSLFKTMQVHSQLNSLTPRSWSPPDSSRKSTDKVPFGMASRSMTVWSGGVSTEYPIYASFFIWLLSIYPTLFFHCYFLPTTCAFISNLITIFHKTIPVPSIFRINRYFSYLIIQYTFI